MAEGNDPYAAPLQASGEERPSPAAKFAESLWLMVPLYVVAGVGLIVLCCQVLMAVMKFVAIHS